MILRRFFICVAIIYIATTVYADELSAFQEYSHKADIAFKNGNTALCFKIEEDIITLFNLNRKKNIKDKDICTIVFNSYCNLAILDNRKSEEEICSLLSSGLALVEENDSWLRDYTNKQHVVSCYVDLIGRYSELGYIELACNYNKRMILFAEKYYRYELIDVLFTACAMYSLMKESENNYPLYRRLYEMFDDLDKYQQYKVVRELVCFEFSKENYSKLVMLALKHEELIVKSKDDIKETILGLIGMGFNKYANMIAQKCVGYYSAEADNAFKIGCDWALRNYPLCFPLICINYAYWLYNFDKYESKALEQFKLYLIAVESNNGELFDNYYRCVEDAENALISIMIQEIIKSSTPLNLNEILSKFPKVISAILESPDSYYYEDFIKVIGLAKVTCYGSK